LCYFQQILASAWAMSARRPVVTMTKCRTASLVLVLLLFGVAMVTMTPVDRNGFDLSSYCAEACRRGLGGIICGCSATKFAGKRSPPRLLPTSTFGDSRSVGAPPRPSAGGGTTQRQSHATSRLPARSQRHVGLASRWTNSRLHATDWRYQT